MAGPTVGRRERTNILKAIFHHVDGVLLCQEGHGAVLLHNTEPAAESSVSLVLRFAFAMQGTEEPVLPALILDDWGSEIRGTDLYDWVNEFGDQFPRAELFGFRLDGRSTQCFLRELDLGTRLLCYAYRTKDTPLSDGVLVQAMALYDETVTQGQRARRPEGISGPLRRAKVSWWRIQSSTDPLTVMFG